MDSSMTGTGPRIQPSRSPAKQVLLSHETWAALYARYQTAFFDAG
jgi:hypothetical protein